MTKDGYRTINVRFRIEEFEDLTTLRKKSNMTWEDFILQLRKDE